MRLQFRLRTLFIVTAVAAVGCWFVDALYWAPFRTRQAPIASPDGSLVLWTSIGQGEGDPSDDGCVILEIRDKQQNLLFRTSSHASAWQRWGVKWLTNGEFKVFSSDIGDYVWKRQPDRTWKRQED